MSVIIAGIHTGIGKTICSAVICQALGYDYWKPVQAGDLEHSDSIFIKKTVTNPSCIIHEERYKLSIAASPHYAAKKDGIKINREDFALPQSKNNILVETAGGVMSPITDNFLAIDLIKQLNLPVIVVSANYLGSINHSLLTVAALQQRNIPITGIVFSGIDSASSESFILGYTGLPLLFRIPSFEKTDSKTIEAFAKKIAIKI